MNSARHEMKWMAILAVMLAGPALGLAHANSEERLVPVQEVFLPSKTDPGSETYVVASGYFPSTCYRLNRTEVERTSERVFEIRTIANLDVRLCLTVPVPFSSEVRMGKLTAGSYLLRFLNPDATYLEREMVIE